MIKKIKIDHDTADGLNETIETQDNCPLSNSNASLTFFMGSLRDACESAFCSPTIFDRRPVLVYIHRDKISFREEFYEKSSYLQAIIDYLNANYVVWQCDIDSNSDKLRLCEDWEKMFFDKFYNNFPDQKYPLLIGVMRFFERNTDGIITSQYQFRNLVNDDGLRYNRLTINQENLLAQLKVFKEKCHENERNPTFSFVEKTHLSWEILVEIAKYLSLNDAINAFSIDILPLLDLPQGKFHLSNPSGLFIKKILPKINDEKIVSLEFKSRMLSTEQLDLLSDPTKLISITCHDLQAVYLNRYGLRCFPNWTRLCLHYDRETNYVTLENILYKFQYQLKRFEIHCPGLYVCYNDIDPPKDIEKKVIMVEYLLLDISLQSSRPMYGFLESYQRRYFGAEMKLMKTMPNIRYLHIIIRNDDIERVCYFTIWQLIALTFSKLKKIQIDVCETTSEQKESLMNRALTLQTNIRAHQESFKFKIRPL